MLPLLLFALPAVVQAQFNYEINDGMVTIAENQCFDGALVIPDTVEGFPVTRIGNYAFVDCTSLTNVTIPDSVVSIENSAFAGCTSLASVTIGNSVTGIGSYAFLDCTSLIWVAIPNSVQAIGKLAFGRCTNLTNVTISTNLNTIAEGAFYSCSSLTNVTIPNSVTSIWDGAFGSCTRLANIMFGSRVAKIGVGAFYGCTSLTSVTIGNSTTNIGARAFVSCTNLSEIDVDALNSFYSSVDGVLFDKSQATLIKYPGGKAGGYTVSNSVTLIQDYAFVGSSRMTSVSIPNSVTYIGSNAFVDCTSLTNVSIPNSVISISDATFYGCTSLTSVTIPSSVTSIGDAAFGRCTNLNSITVDALNSRFSSFDGVLFNQSQTTLILYPGGKAGSYRIPDSVNRIENGAFYSSDRLTTVTIGPNVTSIGYYAFSNCAGLGAITVEALNPVYSSRDGVLFNKSQSTLIQYPGGKGGNYTIPDGVASIGNEAFRDCARLTNVTIGNSVTSIGVNAFAGCTYLADVTIGKSVTSIGGYAFYGCTGLARVYFHGDSPSIGASVFDGANNATFYYLPGTTGWGPTFAGHSALLWNPQLRTRDEGFGVRTNQYGFTITGTSGLVIVVEAATDLAQPVWAPVGTNTVAGGASYFSDPQWIDYPSRFYRLRSP